MDGPAASPMAGGLPRASRRCRRRTAHPPTHIARVHAVGGSARLAPRPAYIIVAMSKALVAVGIVVLVLIGLGGWAVGVNNELVARDQSVSEKWAQVQNVYQRRADLVPNLVETVKGFAAQERTVLEEVTRARASVAGIKATPELVNDPQALQKFLQAQNELGGALARLLVVVENYPDLKSNANFLSLQSQLEGTENRIAVERRRFNEAVRDYNTRLKVFPGSLVGRLAGFQDKAYFEAAAGSEAAPKVKF